MRTAPGVHGGTSSMDEVSFGAPTTTNDGAHLREAAPVPLAIHAVQEAAWRREMLAESRIMAARSSRPAATRAQGGSGTAGMPTG